MSPKAIGFVAGTVLLAGGAASLLWLHGEPAPAGLLRPGDQEVVTLGARIYRENCASCHGAALEGQPDWQSPGSDGRLPAPPHDETGHSWHHPDQVLFDLTKHGVQKFAGADYSSDMPAFADVLTDAEIIAVLSFIKSRWPAQPRDYQERMNARAGNSARE
jgi:mono/diheme cytochrome c family protein